MSPKATIPVQVLGQEYRIRSDADPAVIRRAAAVVDETMTRVRDRTGTVDSVDVAVLAALNIANHLISLRDGSSRAVREGLPALAEDAVDPERVASLIELVELALVDEPANPS